MSNKHKKSYFKTRYEQLKTATYKKIHHIIPKLYVVDPEGTKKHDDAIGFETTRNGLRVVVAISGVSKYATITTDQGLVEITPPEDTHQYSVTNTSIEHVVIDMLFNGRVDYEVKTQRVTTTKEDYDELEQIIRTNFNDQLYIVSSKELISRVMKASNIIVAKYLREQHGTTIYYQPLEVHNQLFDVYRTDRGQRTRITAPLRRLEDLLILNLLYTDHPEQKITEYCRAINIRNLKRYEIQRETLRLIQQIKRDREALSKIKKAHDIREKSRIINELGLTDDEQKNPSRIIKNLQCDNTKLLRRMAGLDKAIETLTELVNT